MTQFKDLIIATNFSDVWNCITRHYEIKKHNSYANFKQLYEKLVSHPLEENKDNTCIYINVFKDDETGDSHNVTNFDENDTSLFFDVSGRVGEDWGYSLVAVRHEDWVSYSMDEETLEKFTYQNIIAHCLLEMAFFGFEQKWSETGELIVE